MTEPTPTLFQGQPALQLKAPDGAQATVLLHGAHLVSWKTASGREMLYLSPQAQYGVGASVRGGVPVIFPQFNQRGKLPRHGLVRTRAWTPQDNGVRGGYATATLGLQSDMATRVHWKQNFALELTVSVAGECLDIELMVANTGDTDFEFAAALHTYLRLDDLLKTQLLGMQDVFYEDALNANTWTGPAGALTTFVGAVDRVYHQVPGDLVLSEPGRSLRIGMSEFEDAVVWNPGAAGAQALNDLPDTDWTQFLCVEAGRILRPISLQPGEEWAGRQSFTLGGGR